MFCLLLWVWAGAGGEFMRKPVGKWSNDDVIEWVEGLGEWAQHNYSDIFRKEVRKMKEGKFLRTYIVSISCTFTPFLSLVTLSPPLPTLFLNCLPFFPLSLSPFLFFLSLSLLPPLLPFLLFSTNRRSQVLVCYC